MEIEDTYLRLDRDISAFSDSGSFDTRFGEGKIIYCS